MKFLALTTLMVLILSANWGFATPAKPLCEAEMLPAVQKVVRVVTLGLASRDLDPADVEFMLSDSDKLQNPYRQKNKNEKNITYGQTLKRDLPKLKPEEVAQARTALTQLIQSEGRRQETIGVARHETRKIFKAQEVLLTDAPASFRSTIVWNTPTSSGQPQLVSYFADHTRLQIFDPLDGKTLEDRFIVPHNGRGGDFTNRNFMDKGHVIAFKHYHSSGEVFIHNIEQNRTGVTSNLPLLSHLKIVKSANGIYYVIAFNDFNILTYKIDADLRLQLHSSQPKLSTKFAVANSADGQVLVAARVNSLRQIRIFDPINDSVKKQLKLPGYVNSISPTILPDGKYAIALTREMKNKYSQFLFITSESDEVMKSDLLDTNARSSEWFITQDGRALFAIQALAPPSLHASGVLVYEPLKSTFRPGNRWLPKFMSSQKPILPAYALQVENVLGTPSFYQSPEGRLFVLIGSCENQQADNCKAHVFEPETQPTPTHEFAVSRFDPNSHIEPHPDPSMKQLLFTFNHSVGGEIYSGTIENAGRIFSSDKLTFGQVFSHPNGNVYVYARSEDRLHLFRLTSDSREMQP